MKILNETEDFVGINQRDQTCFGRSRSLFPKIAPCSVSPYGATAIKFVPSNRRVTEKELL